MTEQQHDFTDTEKMCIHEASHAVVAVICGFPVEGIVIDTHAGLPHLISITGDTAGSFYYELLVAAAGKEGEIKFKIKCDPTFYSTDSVDITAMTMLLYWLRGTIYKPENRLHLSEQIYKLMVRIWKNVNRIIKTPVRSAILELAELMSAEIATGSMIIPSETIYSVVRQRLGDEVVDRREPDFSFPSWYLSLCKKSQEDLLAERKKDFAAIWEFAEAQKQTDKEQ